MRALSHSTTPLSPRRPVSARLGEKLKGNLPKGRFDKRVRIDLPVPLPVPSPLPSPFPSCSTLSGKTTPHHPPEPDPKPLPQGHQYEQAPSLRKAPPIKNYLQFLPDGWLLKKAGCHHRAPQLNLPQASPTKGWSGRSTSPRGSDFDPQTPEFFDKDFCLQPGLEWKCLLRRIWSGRKLLPLQFPRLPLS